MWLALPWRRTPYISTLTASMVRPSNSMYFCDNPCISIAENPFDLLGGRSMTLPGLSALTVTLFVQFVPVFANGLSMYSA